ncbi:hypothetical protein MJO28_009109 [Puccinia striiformis f. sp. tritici]|uniref:Uncharacterized protein n=1 Tax=Puccinia striiformis f. sp. tritici TaxID=168172 RepID=A0ACC0E8B6_9BASI|nr:hypothetical protein Pst134EB_018831 [Puccinia striiformis f. sp. tritici]KAI7933303.1 hypothetical protein MJO28_017733 [Puccinia striiformis f. sp. tritici]KAI7947201.1 hypothetical protein MJO28_009109 [Puccinia striiformis f. sp. tritici]
MANHMNCNSFFIVLLIAIVALILPDRASTTVSPIANQAPSLNPEDLQFGQNYRSVGSQKPSSGTKQRKTVYIITLDATATEAQILAYKQRLRKQGAVILYEYAIIKGFAVSIKPSHLKTLQKDPLVVDIEQDQRVDIDDNDKL